MDDNTIYETEVVDDMGGDNSGHIDFYKKLRSSIEEYLAKHPGIKFAGYLAAVPDVFYLIIRLMSDSRVPFGAKVKLGGAVSYFLLPVDIVPDVIPFAGWMDDLVVSVTLLNRALGEIDPAIVDEYWCGDVKIYDFIKSVLDKGDKLVGGRVWNAVKSVFVRK